MKVASVQIIFLPLFYDFFPWNWVKYTAYPIHHRAGGFSEKLIFLWALFLKRRKKSHFADENAGQTARSTGKVHLFSGKSCRIFRTPVFGRADAHALFEGAAEMLVIKKARIGRNRLDHVCACGQAAAYVLQTAVGQISRKTGADFLLEEGRKIVLGQPGRFSGDLSQYTGWRSPALRCRW